jgi:hypothetical protein
VHIVKRDSLKAFAPEISQLALEDRQRQREMVDEVVVIICNAVVGHDRDTRRAHVNG